MAKTFPAVSYVRGTPSDRFIFENSWGRRVGTVRPLPGGQRAIVDCGRRGGCLNCQIDPAGPPPSHEQCVRCRPQSGPVMASFDRLVVTSSRPWSEPHASPWGFAPVIARIGAVHRGARTYFAVEPRGDITRSEAQGPTADATGCGMHGAAIGQARRRPKLRAICRRGTPARSR